MDQNILKTVQRHYATLGISSSSSQSTSKYLFNERLLFSFLLFGYLIVSQIVYIYYLASGFMEYMECFSSMLASFIIFICLMAIAYRTTKLFESIQNMEKIIETSESFLSYLFMIYDFRLY